MKDRGEPIDLDAIEARVRDTGVDLWDVSCDVNDPHDQCAMVVLRSDHGVCVAPFLTRAAAEFIAHAREDVPALVAEVRRLRACASERVPAGPHIDFLRADLAAAQKMAAQCEPDDVLGRASFEGHAQRRERELAQAQTVNALLDVAARIRGDAFGSSDAEKAHRAQEALLPVAVASGIVLATAREMEHLGREAERTAADELESRVEEAIGSVDASLRAFETLRDLLRRGLAMEAIALAQAIDSEGDDGTESFAAKKAQLPEHVREIGTRYIYTLLAETLRARLDAIGSANHATWSVTFPEDGRRLDITAEWVGGESVASRVKRVERERDAALDEVAVVRAEVAKGLVAAERAGESLASVTAERDALRRSLAAAATGKMPRCETCGDRLATRQWSGTPNDPCGVCDRCFREEQQSEADVGNALDEETCVDLPHAAVLRDAIGGAE